MYPISHTALHTGLQNLRLSDQPRQLGAEHHCQYQLQPAEHQRRLHLPRSHPGVNRHLPGAIHQRGHGAGSICDPGGLRSDPAGVPHLLAGDYLLAHLLAFWLQEFGLRRVGDTRFHVFCCAWGTLDPADCWRAQL